ncbi:AUT2/APG4/ATG4 cysteine peptidase [Trypanosoma rangeli]|uniref:Cysteine protease n=1 Tax=Trypanosoma rangeli TaxID=5698 RepID=A0A422NI42_TRYRA|nr:AUT2/APG4/ATG4 cysteine peptidase [Trypanosoma rangeli]RNF05054.1 AUT2/APG4/ATG4 cysteine peptidase [Trypanosoma rangeli]|eukprot:RNF05054.1 AUT2/APG4/ATG4 cysteine peptidase [Trypanosoma rangeli]
MVVGRRKADGAPSCDSADLIKSMYNFMFKLWVGKTPLMDDVETYIIGSGMYSGSETTKWADKATAALLYFSHRNRIVPLMNGSTTDLFWGCMIRTGQMMLAHVLMRYFTGGGPRIGDEKLQELRAKAQVLFCDVPSAPFSIHAITAEGERHGVKCGEWFGPTPIANTLSALSASYLAAGGEGPVVLSFPDRQIFGEQVKELLRESKHVVLLIPVMLGPHVISKKYARFMERCLEMESSVGILGGKSRSAYFLFGHQGDSVFYLDPHYLQIAFTLPDRPGELTCARRALPATSYDTSMTLGFYVSSLASFAIFEEDLAKINAGLTFPLISISAGRPVEEGKVDADAKLNLNESFSFPPG